MNAENAIKRVTLGDLLKESQKPEGLSNQAVLRVRDFGTDSIYDVGSWEVDDNGNLVLGP